MSNSKWRVTVELNVGTKSIYRYFICNTRKEAYVVANEWARHGCPADIDRYDAKRKVGLPS